MWLWVLLSVLATLVVVVLAARWLLPRIVRPPKDLVERFGRLTWRQRLDLGVALVRDPRLSWAVRLLIPAVVIYLALPLDLIPDFIPVIGALDDVLVVLLALRLLLRAVPRDLLGEHFERLESGDTSADRSKRDDATLDREPRTSAILDRQD